MASKDYKNQTKSVVSIKPQTASGNVNGLEVDTKGFEGVTLKLSAGAGSVAGTVKIQESDTSGSGYADAGANDVIGTQGVAIVQDDVVTIGYIGLKRYVRAVFTHSGNGEVCGVFDLECPHVGKTGANS